MSDQPEKFDLTSHDISEDKRQELLRLFPEIRTEGDKLDFERLKLALGEAVEVGKERYGMNWPGKADCFKTIQAPSMGTLRPCPEESVNFDTSENLIIEGDNLEVLKLLQKSYLGKVKMIYIDPPYNTGNDFIYPDNYSESLQTYLEYTGQVDAEGRKFGTNTDADGRFHSKWLNMMYPRLYLARNLLREDGVIFISIDEHEASNLKRLCDEVFGEENFCCQFVWHTEGNTDNQYKVKVVHEYVTAYYKDINYSEEAIGCVVDPNTPKESNLWKGVADNNINKNSPANPPDTVVLPVGFPCAEKTLSYSKKNVDDEFFRVTREQKYISEEIQDKYGIEKKSGLPVKLDDLEVQDYKLVKPCRIYGGMANKIKLLEFIKNGCRPIMDDGTPLRFYLNANAAVRYFRENEKPRNILSVLRKLGTTEKTKTYLKNLSLRYDYPKPVGLIQYLMRIGCERDGIILDFFAGSGTTGEAALLNNLETGSKKQYILVQLPEPTEREDYPTIADITKERVRRVIKNLNDEDAGKLDLDGAGKQDRGFRVFKLSESNLNSWNAAVPHDAEALEQQLELHIDHIRDGRTADDLLFEILLKSGFPLTTTVEKLTFPPHPSPLPPGERENNASPPLMYPKGHKGGDRGEGAKTVYSVACGALFICLERQITLELIRAMAEAKPERVVCLDEGFAGNDQLKANAVQIFKTKGVTSFKTV
jgi:adenine-specific DNA-methyltransferase